MKFSTSLICADQVNLANDVSFIMHNGGEDFSYFHADFMDGHFVPRYGIVPEVLMDLKHYFGKDIHIDSHLMVADPIHYLPVIAPYSDWVFVHKEALTDPVRCLQVLRKEYPKVKIGLAYNLLSGPIDDCHVLPENNLMDGCLLMGISPGVLGTNSYPSIVLDKIKYLRDLDIDMPIFVDGSINFKTLPDYAKRGLDYAVCGSSTIFKDASITQHDRKSRQDIILENIQKLKEIK